MNKVLSKKGNVLTMELAIILLILTFFIFFPFAIYSSYQEKNILEDIKDRGLQIVSTTGRADEDTIRTLMNEFNFYKLKPKQGQEITITFYNIDIDSGEMESEKKAVYKFVNNNGLLEGIEPIEDTMGIALKENRDIIRMTIEYPGGDFLNSILRLIGRKTKGIYKVSGFIMSEAENEEG